MYAYTKLPHHMHEEIRAYIELGKPTGSFLRAVLENNLVQVYAFADETNTEAMRNWASFLYNEMPTGSWGNRENVDAWIIRGGLSGVS